MAIAEHTSEDESSGLADAALMAKEIMDFDLYHTWDITPEQAIEKALICEVAAFDADSRIKNADGTTLNTHQGCRVYGNSNGFIGGYASTRHSLSCVMIAEGEGQMQRDYWYDVNRQGELLADAQSIGRKAALRAASRLGRVLCRPVKCRCCLPQNWQVACSAAFSVPFPVATCTVNRHFWRGPWVSGCSRSG